MTFGASTRTGSATGARVNDASARTTVCRAALRSSTRPVAPAAIEMCSPRRTSFASRCGVSIAFANSPSS